MNADEMLWRCLANGQRVMGAELLNLAKSARNVEEVRQCVDLANKCALIEASCLERANGERVQVGKVSWYACPHCGKKL